MVQPHLKPSHRHGPRPLVQTWNANKQLLVRQIVQAMKAQKLSKTEMARRMRTSRTQLERLLDPDNDRVLLKTVQRAALAVGKQLNVALVDESQNRGGRHE